MKKANLHKSKNNINKKFRFLVVKNKEEVIRKEMIFLIKKIRYKELTSLFNSQSLLLFKDPKMIFLGIKYHMLKLIHKKFKKFLFKKMTKFKLYIKNWMKFINYALNFKQKLI
jgi:hypothetical protein